MSTVLSHEDLKLEFPARPESLDRARSALRIWLRDAGATPDELFEIVTVCGELCMNAIVHAYAADAGPLEIRGRCRDGEVEITVRDRGRWCSTRGKSGGIGFSIVRAMTDCLFRHSKEDGTEALIRRRLKRGTSI